MGSTMLARRFSGTNLSDYWRTDHSAVRASDLASVLEGARAAVSMMEGKLPVRWLSQGMSGPGIWLDPSVLNGFEPPFPGKAVDVVIGLALHEVGHEKWTRPFPRGTRLNRLSTRQCETLFSIHNILEDAYVDTHTGRLSPVLGEYITTARQAFVSRKGAEIACEMLREAPNRENVLDVWAGISLYHLPLTSQDAHPDMLNVIIHLVDETMRYIELDSTRARADRAWRVFKYVDSLPEPPTAPQQAEAPETKSSTPPDANPWLDDGSDGESDSSGEAEAAPRQQAPAMTRWDDDDVDEDWDEGEDEIRDDTRQEADTSDDLEVEGPDRGEEHEDDSVADTPRNESDASDDSREDAEESSPDEEDSDDSEPGTTAHCDEDTDEDDVEGAGEGDDDAASGAEGDEVSDQLLRNLTSGMGSRCGRHTLSEISDYLEERGKGWLTEEEAEEVEAAMKDERRDMAPLLARELDMPRLGRSPYVMQQAQYDPGAHASVAGRVARETAAMRAALQKIDEVGARWRYGTHNGRLDTRRLAKAAAGKDSVYKRRDARGRPTTAISLVLDVSGSMYRHLGTVADVAAIFSGALRDMGVWYEVSCYTSGGATVDLDGPRPGRADASSPSYTILATPQKPLSLARVGAGGGTPSGEAIATACIRLAARPERRKLLIHFTDGYPDDYRVLFAATDYAERHGIILLTISVYHWAAGRCRVIRDVSDLPQATEELLREVY